MNLYLKEASYIKGKYLENYTLYFIKKAKQIVFIYKNLTTLTMPP